MLRLLSALVLFGTVATLTAQEPKDPKAAAPKAEQLVGEWKLTKSDTELPPGLTASLTIIKDGKLAMKVEFMNQKLDATGTWKLDGAKLHVEYSDGKEKGKKETMEVTKLTETELVTADPKGKTDFFERVKAAKK